MLSDVKLVSIIIRTLNEGLYLGELLKVINSQITTGFSFEVVIIDSGSNDSTLEIAREYNARVTFIDKQQFTFGRSLNLGCEFSYGDYLVFIRHCIPTNEQWLFNLVSPLIQGVCEYTYGKQIGRDSTKFSERQVFNKYFRDESKLPQDGYFCNNANAAVKRDVWLKYKFNEDLTGLEDMFLAKEIYRDGFKIGYVKNSCVYHIHDETWQQIKNRYERESIALQNIMPEVEISFFDMIHFILVGVFQDMRAAMLAKVFVKEFISIICFRSVQFYGSYRGNHAVRKLSRKKKLTYFYPTIRKG